MVRGVEGNAVELLPGELGPIRQDDVRRPAERLGKGIGVEHAFRAAGIEDEQGLRPPFRPAELRQECARRAQRRQRGVADQQTQVGLRQAVCRGRIHPATAPDLVAVLRGEPLALSPREHAVLRVLVQRSGEPFSKQQILDRVFTDDDDVHPEAVEVFVHRLRKRLDGSGVRITTLRGLGYALEANDVDPP